MGTYTIELRELMDFHDVEKLALKEYPVFDEGYRLPLNRKILDHFYMQEIGFETADLFIFHLKRKMNEIMPYYNQLYRSEQLRFDPLNTIDISTLGESSNDVHQTSESTNTTTSDTTSDSRAVGSDTPQTQLSGREDYASSIADSHGVTKATGEGVSGDTTTGTGTTSQGNAARGRRGPVGALLADWRASMLNVDMMVVSEIQPLFMGLWNNGDRTSANVVPVWRGFGMIGY